MKHYKPSSVFTRCLAFLLMTVINLSHAQYISVDTSNTPQQLVDKFIGTQNAGCIAVSNVSVSGWDFGTDDLSFGYFTKGTSNFSIDEGIILSTGKALEASGPNNNLQSNYDSRWLGDADLVSILSQSGLPTDNILNATVLEFDFISQQSDKISFDYMFLSEEYRINNCQYSDAFAFLIKKANTVDPYKNIALVPGTSTPVTSLSINGATNCPRNLNYFGGFNGNNSPTNFNGQTKVLKAATTVQKGVKYHIKLVIADHGDSRGLYDSAVFLKSGSFTGGIDIGNNLLVENANPLCDNVPYRIQPNPSLNDPAAKYFWFKDGLPISVPSNQPYYDVINEEGTFGLSVVLGSGCKLEGNVIIEKAPAAQINPAPILICDNDFDGKFTAKLSDYDNQIIRDYDPATMTRSYSLTPNGPAINPNTDFVFTQNTQTLYVRVGVFACAAIPYPVTFFIGTKLTVEPVSPVDICDEDLSGDEKIDLSAYLSKITKEIGVSASYFATEAQAKIGGISTITAAQTISANQSFFIRIEKYGFCPNYKEIKFNFKQSKKSSSLPKDPILICKGETTTLDAGAGFTSYEWSNGAITSDIKNVPAGDYWVKLGFNGCIYQQFVKVVEAEEPVIDNVLIEGNTVTILASGGSKPYLYALDNGNYQSSNIFSNVDLGGHKAFVKGADACSEVSKEFTLINVQNVITPNQDGVNDIINYSSLLSKSNPRFEIYDRYGVLLFKGDSNNQFIWDGRLNGRTLSTDSYWYVLEWDEVGNPNRTQLSGWILLKNRN